MLDKLFSPRTLAGIVVTLVIGAGAAVAATDTGPRPTLPAEETTTSTVQATTSTSVEETTTSTTTADATTKSTSTTEPAKPDSTTGDHPDNHGACVSKAAHDTPPGPGHGAAVSKVAQSDCGKSANASGGGDTNETPETEAPESDTHAPSGNHGHGHDSSGD